MKKSLSLWFTLIGGLLLSTGTLSDVYACSKEQVVAAVEEAVLILERDGEAGLPAVGKIRFCDGNYVFINDFKGKTLMHIGTHLIGKVLIGLKDDQGKRFFADFTAMAQSSKTSDSGKDYFNGTGWVSYRWPKPGEKVFSPKLTFIKGCLMGEQNVYAGAGIYE